MSQPLPVLCDLCRTTGTAGEAPFADLADLLSFTPVQRRARADGWDEERQRAFIAALVVTGSPRQAARAIGKHAFGAEQLRKARGGASFAAAWDAAIEISRERELAGLHDGLADLAASHEAETAHRRSLIVPAAASRDDSADDDASADRPPPTFDRYGLQQFTEADRQDYLAGVKRVQERLTSSRRLLLLALVDDPARRAAWETLVGPVDWDKAARLEAQADEPFGDAAEGGGGQWSMRRPDMLMVAEAGLAPDLTGGKDGLAPIAAEVDRMRAAQAGPRDEQLSEEEAEAVAAYRAGLIADGWVEDGDGNLWSPDPTGAE